MIVKDLKIREVFATNSQKTIEIEIRTDRGRSIASVPFGTSRSRYEVCYLPVEEAEKRFLDIKDRLISQQFSSIEEVDNFLKAADGTQTLRNLGGNLTLAVSSAFLKAFALEDGKQIFEYLPKEKSIPLPVCNVAGGWRGQSDIQEFLFLPDRQESFLDSITRISQAYLMLGTRLKENDSTFAFGKNIESGWLTSLNFERVLDIMSGIADECNLKTGLDVAASQLWDGSSYTYRNGEKLTRTGQLDTMTELSKKYPIIYIEDPFSEDDFTSFSTLTHRLRGKMVVGDDLFSTDLHKLQYGISYKAASGIIIKMSQAGTISDTMKVMEEARRSNIKTIVSHRSGETDDVLMCHLAVGMGCDYIKIGISGERTAKINEMIRIEEKLSSGNPI